MKKHLVIGVLALAVLLVSSGAYSLYAGNHEADTNGKCSMSADGTKGACASAAQSCDHASADCDPSQCGSMTPEQCAAKGCQPGQCSKTGTSDKLISAESTTSAKASGCGSAPCAPSPGCGTGSGCGMTSGSSDET